jgi:ABC-type tungstate transport system permease subunit
MMKTLSSVSIFLLILSVVFVAVTSSNAADQLKPGMANTVSLADGSVVYDLNGEWDAHIDNGRYGISEDVIKITQEGNKFVGIKLIGNQYVGKGEETIRGELEGKGFKSLEGYTKMEGWVPSAGKILDGGNKIANQTEVVTLSLTVVETLTRK